MVSVERNPRDQNQFFNERNSSQANQMATLEKWREFLFFRGSYFYPPSNKQSRQNVLHRALLISVAAHHGISSACFFQPGAKILTSNLKQLFFYSEFFWVKIQMKPFLHWCGDQTLRNFFHRFVMWKWQSFPLHLHFFLKLYLWTILVCSPGSRNVLIKMLLQPVAE